MKTIATWCRNLDNIIGHRNTIPWHISSDFKRFKRLTLNNWLLMGQNTYESLPNKTLPNRNILVLSADENYAVTDNTKDYVVNSLNNFYKNISEKYNPEELYICGGANVYTQFLKQPELQPNYVVDCFYQDSITGHSSDDKYIYINECIEALEKDYNKTFINELDNVKTYIWTKKFDKIDTEKDPTFINLKTKILGESNE